MNYQLLCLCLLFVGCQSRNLFTFRVILNTDASTPPAQSLSIKTEGAPVIDEVVTLSSPSLLPAEFTFMLPDGLVPSPRITHLALFDAQGVEQARDSQSITFQRGALTTIALTPSREGDCSDLQDGDRDNLTDCQDSDCSQDLACLDFCGDGKITAPEECEGDNLNQLNCNALSFTGGVLSCDAQCRLDVSGCTTCGDAILEPGEECESEQDITGSKDCTPLCQFATCGDGFIASLSETSFEACDDGNLDTDDGCSPLCLFDESSLSPIADLSGLEMRGLSANSTNPRFIYLLASDGAQSSLLSHSLSGLREVHPDVPNGVTPLTTFTGAILVAGSRDVAGELHRVIELIDPVSEAKLTVLSEPNATPPTAIDRIFANDYFFGAADGVHKITAGNTPQTTFIDDGLLDNQYVAFFHGTGTPETGFGVIASQSQVSLHDFSQDPARVLMLDALPAGAEVTGVAFLSVLDIPTFGFNDRGFVVSFTLPTLQKSFVKQYVRKSDGEILGRLLLEVDTSPTGITALSYDFVRGQLLMVANHQLVALPMGLNFSGINDLDQDGILDSLESSLCNTNPLATDTDGDTLSDGFECSASHDLGMLFSPVLPDTDNDGTPDALELP